MTHDQQAEIDQLREEAAYVRKTLGLPPETPWVGYGKETPQTVVGALNELTGQRDHWRQMYEDLARYKIETKQP